MDEPVNLVTFPEPTEHQTMLWSTGMKADQLKARASYRRGAVVTVGDLKVYPTRRETEKVFTEGVKIPVTWEHISRAVEEKEKWERFEKYCLEDNIFYIGENGKKIIGTVQRNHRKTYYQPDRMGYPVAVLTDEDE